MIVLDSLYLWSGSQDILQPCVKSNQSILYMNNLQFHTDTLALNCFNYSELQITDCLFTYYTATIEFPSNFIRLGDVRGDIIIKDCHVQSGVCSAGFFGLDSTPSFGFLSQAATGAIYPVRFVFSNIRSFGYVPLRYFVQYRHLFSNSITSPQRSIYMFNNTINTSDFLNINDAQYINNLNKIVLRNNNITFTPYFGQN